MDEQISIRDKLIKAASSKLKKLKISTLFNNSLLVNDPYGICVEELSETENYPKKIGLSKKPNNSLPQLMALRSSEEKDKEYFETPKVHPFKHEKTNSSFDSPYLKKKQEIEEIISKRYSNLQKMTVEK